MPRKPALQQERIRATPTATPEIAVPDSAHIYLTCCSHPRANPVRARREIPAARARGPTEADAASLIPLFACDPSFLPAPSAPIRAAIEAQSFPPDRPPDARESPLEVSPARQHAEKARAESPDSGPK